jgi:hypothetical protein
MAANPSTTVTIDLIDKITVIAGRILATMIGIDVIITAATTVMTGAMTTVAMTTMSSETTTGVIIVMTAITTSATTGEMIHATIDVAKMTIITRITIRRNELHHHRQRGKP